MDSTDPGRLRGLDPRERCPVCDFSYALVVYTRPDGTILEQGCRICGWNERFVAPAYLNVSWFKWRRPQP